MQNIVLKRKTAYMKHRLSHKSNIRIYKDVQM